MEVRYQKELDQQKIDALWKRERRQTPYLRLALTLLCVVIVWILRNRNFGGSLFLFLTLIFAASVILCWSLFHYRRLSLRQLFNWWVIKISVETLYAGYLIFLTGGASSPLAPLLAVSLLRVLVLFPQIRAFNILLLIHLLVYLTVDIRIGGVAVFSQPTFLFTLLLIICTGLMVANLINHNDEINIARMKMATERAELKLMALTDGLTEIYNHRYFEICLEEEVHRAARFNMPLSLLIIDLDFFKTYNDTLGHPAGDRVLKKVAELLHEQLRSTDVLCRYGGDEFVAILIGAKAMDAQQIAAKLRQTVEKYPFQGKQYLIGGKLTISAGVATFPDDAQNMVDLLEEADHRLYQEKASLKAAASFAEIKHLPL